MNTQFWLVNLAIICSLLVGCRKEDPNPELLDPIYNDLRAQLASAESAVEAMSKKLEAAKKELTISEPRSLDRRIARDNIEKYTQGLTKAEELREFYTIRVARRLAETRKSYKQAFRKNAPWPDPNEYEYYKINKKLVTAPQNWTQRLVDIKGDAGKEPSGNSN